MLYSYICKKCNNKMEVDIRPEELNNFKPVCSECGSGMRRDWKAGITIGAGDRSDEIQSTSFAKERLKIRPSGKTQVFY